MTDTVEQLGPDEVLQEARELLRFYQASDPSKPYTCSVIADCISMIEALRAATEWRDISTAPRDGTIILLGNIGSEPRPAYWGLAKDAFGAGADSRFPWTFLDSTNGVNHLSDDETGATHWQPLPAPPQRNEVKK